MSASSTVSSRMGSGLLPDMAVVARLTPPPSCHVPMRLHECSRTSRNCLRGSRTVLVSDAHTHTHTRPGSAIGWATSACMQCVHSTKHLSQPPFSALVALQLSPTHSASMRQQACCLLRMHLLQLSHRTSCWLRSAAAVNWGGGGANNTQLSQTEINCLTHNCDHVGSY